MVDAYGLLRLFWPSDIARTDAQGTIIGWRNSPLDFFVVAVLQEVEVRTQAIQDPRTRLIEEGAQGRGGFANRDVISR